MNNSVMKFGNREKASLLNPMYVGGMGEKNKEVSCFFFLSLSVNFHGF